MSETYPLRAKPGISVRITLHGARVSLARRYPLRHKNVLTYTAISQKYIVKEKCIGFPTRLILVDEADRLKMISLEQMRPIFDAGDVGLDLIGMRGIEKRMASDAAVSTITPPLRSWRAYGIAKSSVPTPVSKRVPLFPSGICLVVSGPRTNATCWRRFAKRSFERHASIRRTRFGASCQACSSGVYRRVALCRWIRLSF
jgi:hypothetical protein